MKRLRLKRFLYISALIAAHAVAISSGAFFRQQVARAQEGGTTYGKKYVDIDGKLVACDCTRAVRECACITELGP